MKQYGASLKSPRLLSLIFNDVRSAFARDREMKRLARARIHLDHDDPAPMEGIAHTSLGDAWLALADFYTDRRPDDATLATEAYRNAAQSKHWFNYTSRAEEEYDRRRFLGIGATPSFRELAKEWKSQHFPGYGRETKLAWIHACGSADLRDLQEAWWWIAVTEARWGRCKDNDLPTLSVIELREHLVRSVPEIDRLRLQAKAKEYAYREFISCK